MNRNHSDIEGVAQRVPKRANERRRAIAYYSLRISEQYSPVVGDYGDEATRSVILDESRADKTAETADDNHGRMFLRLMKCWGEMRRWR